MAISVPTVAPAALTPPPALRPVSVLEPATGPEPCPAPATPDALSFEAAIAQLRDDVFALLDVARFAASGDPVGLHVSLQSVANELGRAERLLRVQR